MMEKMKYGAPELEVIEMQIEQGFAATGKPDAGTVDGDYGGEV